MIGVMQGSYTEKNLHNFFTDLKAGKATLRKLVAKMIIKDAELWDGKDAPTMPDDDIDEYGDDSENASQHEDL